MHFAPPSNPIALEQLLWALILAAHLVTLIILFGRDRMRRFPWFTAAIAVSAIRLLADHLLHGRLTTLAFYWQQYSLLLISAMIGGFVVAELTRLAFGPQSASDAIHPRLRLGWSFIALVFAGGIVAAIGPWPSWQSIVEDKQLFALRLVWIAALKLELFVGVLAVLLTFALLIASRRFGNRLSGHVTQIALGLSTIAISQVAVQRAIESIIHGAHPASQTQYNQILRLLTNLDHARVALWLLAVLWWIVWLWRDEPGSTPLASNSGNPPVLSGTISASEDPEN